MTRSLSILILLALCSCSSVEGRRPKVEGLAIAGMMPPPAQPSSAAAVPAPKPIFLAWDNPNPSQLLPYLFCEIHSTANLIQSFTPFAFVRATTNAIAFWPTNQSGFFIARFVLTNNPYMPPTVSDWAHR